MELIMIVVIGCLFTAATYLLLSKSLLRIIIGTGLLSHGAHLLLLTMGVKSWSASAFRGEGGTIRRSVAASTHFNSDRH